MASDVRWSDPYANEAAELLNAHVSRRRADQDVELLKNRLALLRAEEAKAQAKITQTAVRAQQLIQARERNVKSRVEKDKHEQAKQAELAAKHQQFSQVRHQRRAEKASLMQKQQAQRREVVEGTG